MRDAALSTEEIGELYQAAESESFRWEDLPAGEQDRARQFVSERLLPLLLRRP